MSLSVVVVALGLPVVVVVALGLSVVVVVALGLPVVVVALGLSEVLVGVSLSAVLAGVGLTEVVFTTPWPLFPPGPGKDFLKTMEARGELLEGPVVGIVVGTVVYS